MKYEERIYTVDQVENVIERVGGGGNGMNKVAWKNITGVPNTFEPKKHGDAKHTKDYATTSQTFSGNYADLSGKPQIFSGQWADLAGKPSSFEPKKHGDAKHTVNYAKNSELFSGSYNDLTNKPSLFSGSHNDLTGVDPSDHHTKYTDSDARNALKGSNPSFGTVTINDVLHMVPKSSPPSSPSNGDVYVDDGTNTSSGNPAFRLYDGGAWTEL